MLMRQILITILLATFGVGSLPSTVSLLSVDRDSEKHQPETPLQDSVETSEKLKAEWDELEVLFLGLLTADDGHQSVCIIGRIDQPVRLSPSVHSSPDHSRAPPVWC